MLLQRPSFLHQYLCKIYVSQTIPTFPSTTTDIKSIIKYCSNYITHQYTPSLIYCRDQSCKLTKIKRLFPTAAAPTVLVLVDVVADLCISVLYCPIRRCLALLKAPYSQLLSPYHTHRVVVLALSNRNYSAHQYPNTAYIHTQQRVEIVHLYLPCYHYCTDNILCQS